MDGTRPLVGARSDTLKKIVLKILDGPVSGAPFSFYASRGGAANDSGGGLWCDNGDGIWTLTGIFTGNCYDESKKINLFEKIQKEFSVPTIFMVKEPFGIFIFTFFCLKHFFKLFVEKHYF